MTSVLLRRVEKRFGSVAAVRPLDLAIPTGSLCGFLGPNGAGKSTTIRMIMSIIRPDAGSIEVLGGDALAMKDRIGYLPEERGLYRKMRVLEFLRFIGSLKGIPSSRSAGVARGWLERLQLPGVERSRCQELSKGMQQKVQFIAAVLHNPELLILDEPFSGLDPVNARVLTEVVRELHDRGKTILFSTHQMHHAEQLCDRVVLINRGEKLLDESMASLDSRFDPRALTVEPLEAPCLAAAYESIPGIASAQAAEDGRSIRLALETEVNPQDVLQRAAAVAPIRSIELQRTTLDEVFVRLVTEHGGHARTPEAAHA